VWAQRANRTHGSLIDSQAGRLGGQRGVHAKQGSAQRDVSENDPARTARRDPVALRPFVQYRRLHVEHLVRPPLRHSRHTGVHGLGFQYEQLASFGALLGRVQAEAGRTDPPNLSRSGRLRR
jgi:hypothetical protein